MAKDAREAIYDFCTSDFATVVTTTAFVDKTMMIKDVFDATDAAFLLITAPPRSGKSTNLDMVRRFLEIQVDNYGNRQPLAQTNNYKLFTENDLEICKLTNFLKRHFGKYPVLYMDWKPLGEVSDYVSMIDVFKTITMGLFELHRYFLKITSVWTDNLKIEEFKSYCNPTGYSFYSENKIICGVQRLSRLLFRHFDKKVFVLIDNCDAFVASDLFRKNGEDRDKMMCFIQTVVDSLLKNNQCVGRALLTGVLPLTGDGFPFGRNKIRCYSFIYSGPFYTYYGLTVDEFDGILEKIETDDKKRNETKRKIECFFNIYSVDQGSENVYNISSILKYLRTKQISVTDKYCIPNFNALYKHSKIRDKLVDVLTGFELRCNISQPLSIKDITLLNNLIDSGSEVDVSSSSVNTVFVLLYHFGYFSVNRITYNIIGTFTIPNEESKSSLTGDILKNNLEFCCCTWDHADKVCSAIYSITSGTATDIELLETILNDWYCNLEPKPGSAAAIYNLSTSLFMVLVASYKYKRTAWRCSPDNKIFLFMLLQKLNGETVCCSVTLNSKVSATDETLRHNAEEACKRVITYRQRDQMFDGFTDVEMIPVVGIGYSRQTRTCKVKIVDIPPTTDDNQKPSSSPDLS